MKHKLSSIYQKKIFMKANLTSRSVLIVLLMAVLIFSTPFTLLAQQNSAEVQAERDAEADVNKLLWSGVGLATPLCVTLGLIVGSLGPQSNVFIFSDEQGRGLCIGSTVGCLGPLILIYKYQLAPPPERLIGKSSEYVDSYTKVYKTKTRKLRAKSAAGAAALGFGLVGMVLSIATAQ